VTSWNTLVSATRRRLRLEWLSEELAKLLLRYPGVLEDLHKELGTHALALVDCEHEDAAVGVDQEAVAPAAAGFAEAGARERRQDPAGGKLGKPSHRLRSDLDFDGDQRLTRRLATLAAQRIDVKLQGPPCTVRRLPAGAAVYVAAGYGRNGSEEAAVLLPIDGHDIAQLHSARMSDREMSGKSAAPSRAAG